MEILTVNDYELVRRKDLVDGMSPQAVVRELGYAHCSPGHGKLPAQESLVQHTETTLSNRPLGAIRILPAAEALREQLARGHTPERWAAVLRHKANGPYAAAGAPLSALPARLTRQRPISMMP